MNARFKEVWEEFVRRNGEQGFFAEAIRDALTLATEAEQLRNDYGSMGVTLAARNSEIEQLRKERDELAEFIKKTNPDVVNVPDDVFLICVRAKKVNENGKSS